MSFIQVPPNSTGSKVDMVTMPSANLRETVIIGDSVTDGLFVTVTAAGAAKVDGSAVTQPISGAVTGSGNFTVVQGTATNLKVDASGVAVPVTDNSGSLTVDNGGTFAVQAAQSGTWNIGTLTTVTNVVHVDDNAGSLTVDGTVTANAGSGTMAVSDTALELSQASTTAAQKGILAMGAVTTNATSYTNGQTDPLSLDASGLLRISLKDTPANTNKLLVTPDSVALPANQSVNVSQINAATPLMGSGNTGTGSLRVTIATDQPALTNKLLVTPDSVALPANQSTNISQINGVTPLMGTGNTGTGSIRVTIATDQAQLTNKLLVTPDANSAVNVAQINGVTTLMGNGVTGTGSQRVTIASDNTAFSVNATLATATSGGLSFTDGTMNATKTQVKGSAGQLYGWYIYNPNASAVYVQIYNLASASVTVGTTVADLALGIPATSAANVFSDIGLAMGTGITFAITTTRGGSTSPASTVDYNFWYK